MTTDLRNFTIPAYIKATDNDAEPPNNIVRYEIIHGNYENKFVLNDVTGHLMLREPLMQRKRNARQINTPNDDIFVLTARAFDLGVPVRFSTTTIRIYPPESRTRVLSFLVPGYNPDKQKVQDTLSQMTGGKVVIQDIRPYTGPQSGGSGGGGGNQGGQKKDEKSLVTATVIYDGNSIVDTVKLREVLSNEGSNQGITLHEENAAVSFTEFPKTGPILTNEKKIILSERLPSRE